MLFLYRKRKIKRTVEIYRMLGDMGFGQENVGIFKKKGQEA